MKKNATSKKAEQLKDLIIENLDCSVQITSEIEIGTNCFDYTEIRFDCHCDADGNDYDVLISVGDEESEEVSFGFWLSGDSYNSQGRYAEDIDFDNVEDCSTGWHGYLNACIEVWDEY